MSIRRSISVAAMSLTLIAGAAKGQATASADTKPEPIPALAGRPDVEGQELLGGKYENPIAGISFQTPVNCKQVKGGGGDEVVRFVN